jgi:hypothetical protein
MRNHSPSAIGGMLGVLYFIGTVLFATLHSASPEEANVIAQVTNLHVTFLFVFLERLLPLSFVSNTVVQLVIGLIVNYLLGLFLGWIIGKLFFREKKEIVSESELSMQ